MTNKTTTKVTVTEMPHPKGIATTIQIQTEGQLLPTVLTAITETPIPTAELTDLIKTAVIQATVDPSKDSLEPESATTLSLP